MNTERLHSLYRNTALADKTDIEDVRQLTEDYPYYALPYLILAKYYFETRHYRFEEMLRQAAMRVKDRKALYEYIHSVQQNIPAHTIEPVLEAEAIIHEPEPESEVHISIEDFLGTDISEQAPEPSEEIIEIQEQPVQEAPVQEAPIQEATIKDFLGTDIAEQAAETLQTEVEVPETEELGIELPIVDSEPEPAIVSEVPTEATVDEEFTIDTHVENPQIDTIEIDYDIIGEEIETEFSFSKSFGAPASSEEEDANSEEESINIADNTSASLNEEIAEPVPSDTLRKYPVYSIDNYFKDQVEAPKKEEKEEVPSPERDFFAWLKAPKGPVETEQKSKIEPIKETVSELPEPLDETEETVEKKPNTMDLIDRFININPQISRPKKEFFNPENMAKRSEVIDLEFVSETLANIYYEQGNYDLAIRAYEKLSLQNPAKESYFADLIEKIKKERK